MVIRFALVTLGAVSLAACRTPTQENTSAKSVPTEPPNTPELVTGCEDNTGSSGTSCFAGRAENGQVVEPPYARASLDITQSYFNLGGDSKVVWSLSTSIDGSLPNPETGQKAVLDATWAAFNSGCAINQTFGAGQSVAPSESAAEVMRTLAQQDDNIILIEGEALAAGFIGNMGETLDPDAIMICLEFHGNTFRTP